MITVIIIVGAVVTITQINRNKPNRSDDVNKTIEIIENAQKEIELEEEALNNKTEIVDVVGEDPDTGDTIGYIEDGELASLPKEDTSTKTPEVIETAPTTEEFMAELDRITDEWFGENK